MSQEAPSLDDQIKEVGREIGMRKNVYPKWVAAKRMSQADMDRRIATMEAAYATLKACKERPAL